MLGFSSYVQLITEGIRQGLPHITSTTHEQFSNLVKSGKVHLSDITEKTDGMTHLMGHDEQGFYTQSSGSGSEKMRNPQDYEARARRRAQETGKPFDPTASNAFGHVHKILQSNANLQSYLANQYNKSKKEVKIRGEVFYKPMGTQVGKEIKFVGTKYDPSHMGSVGKYVVHSKLPENAHIENHDEFNRTMSSSDLNFDHDKIKTKPSSVDVSKERKEFSSLNHSLINSRTTKTNKEAKLAELAKMQTIQKRVSDKVDAHVKSLNLSPRWGSGSEGLVVHPSSSNPDAPRFKVTSDTFRAYKADPTNKQNFKKRNV
jgi:hypothetical protein